MDYEVILEWYRTQMVKFLNSSNRRGKEYGEYLKCWFSEEICDGFPYSRKVKFKQLPMSYNEYFF